MAKTVSIGERIRDEREWLGFTQAQLAEAMKLSAADIVEFEQDTRVPEGDELARLVSVFGLSGPDRLRGEPLAEDAEMAVSLGGKHLDHEDRYQVYRFAEFLRHSGQPPTITRQEATDGE